MAPTPADQLNRSCRCITLDTKALDHLYKDIRAQRPNLFSATATYLSVPDFLVMQDFIRVTDGLLASPAGPRGVFMGYDFHLTPEGPKLIEINTNAGGAYLNDILSRAQLACCPVEDASHYGLVPTAERESFFLGMFRNEWRLAGRSSELRSIAIVDDDPKAQYLYPEFGLFRELFEKNQISSVIADPRELTVREDGLYYEALKIDLVYNRLTDFPLKELPHRHLHELWEKDLLVLTPSPLHHESHAHKLLLTRLSDDAYLRTKNLSDTERALILKVVPKTRLVRATEAPELWARRKTLFFKPVDGFGGRAAYRGDKLTTRVWGEIMKGEYVAQDLVPPGQRTVAGKESALKADLRAYVYDGKIILLAARLYEGQTTNFRTNGGGFSPVYLVSGKGP